MFRVGQRGLLSWLSPDVATYIYTVFFAHKKIRVFIQNIVKLFIPDKIMLKDVTLCLNKQDAVVSGALALGCYETKILDYFISLLRPDMMVIDIGANIGLYTILSSPRVGKNGLVISIEPDATNFLYIKKSIQENNFNNIKIYQQAISDRDGEINLYLCELNNADHRIYNANTGMTSADRKQVKIRTSRLDNLISSELHSKVDIIKMDIQGAEAIAFEGMKNILNSSSNIKILMEFWPWGLKQSGTEPISFLKQIVGLGFKIYELKASNASLTLVTSLEHLASRTLEREHFNLFLSREEQIV